MLWQWPSADKIGKDAHATHPSVCPACKSQKSTAVLDLAEVDDAGGPDLLGGPHGGLEDGVDAAVLLGNHSHMTFSVCGGGYTKSR